MLQDHYRVIGTVSDNGYSLVRNAISVQKNQHVIIKTLRIKNLTPSKKARILKEYTEICKLNYDGIVKTIDLYEEPAQNEIDIVMENFISEPLHAILKTDRFDIAAFLHLAVQLVETVEYLHNHDVIHGNINPHSILISPDMRRIKLTDFGAGSTITDMAGITDRNDIIQNTMPYMSPEQTGRMNRNVDYRCDFYSLGIVFFEMLTGITPFKSKDPLELIHCHIARPPVRPELFVPGMPLSLSDMIMRLMSKTPEERYQSAFGIKADLQLCRRSITDYGHVDRFEIGLKDIPHRFIIPQKLYGREENIKTLVETFEKVCGGSKELILVSGVSGIGKSVLINEIHKPVAGRRGYFITGKYERYKTDSPYSAIIQAFKGMLRQILSETDQVIQRWREKLEASLGPNRGVMTEIFPELELIIGKQPVPAPVGPEEARNRFHLSFESFVSVFVSKEHPLVLFLDDLQWADYASMNLLENLLLSFEIRHMLFICSYRDSDGDGSHPFLELLAKAGKEGLHTSRIDLEPLSSIHIGRLVTNFLKCSEGKGLRLGDLIFKKTAGNPFFINQFLKSLYDQGKIHLNPDEGWTWDEGEIAAMQVTDNVVELLSSNISMLPSGTREILTISSCIGNRFDLETLSGFMEKSMDEVLINLKPAIDEGYILNVSDMFIFTHDRVQEAAYLLIPVQERAFNHYKIGKFLLQKMTKEKNGNNLLFHVTDQLNHCIEILTDSEDKALLFRLNMETGRKAKSTAAFDPALSYFKHAKQLLSPESVENYDADSFSVYEEIADTACLNGDYELMRSCLDKIIPHARNDTQRLKICEIEIRSRFAVQDYTGVVKKSTRFLNELGVTFPGKVGKMDVAVEFLKVKRMLRGMTKEKLLNMKTMEDERQIAIARLYVEMGISANLTDSTLYGYVALKRFAQILQHGLHPYSGLCFIGYGAFISCVAGDIKNAILFGDIALEFSDRPYGQLFRHRTLTKHVALIRHLNESLEECKTAAITAYQLSREAGDQVYVGLASVYWGIIAFITTTDASSLKHIMENYFNITRKSRQIPMIQLHGMICEILGNLTSDNPEPSRLNGSFFNEDMVVPEWVKNQNYTGLTLYHAMKIIHCYLLFQFEEAATLTERVRAYSNHVKIPLIMNFIDYIDCLVQLAMFRGKSWSDKRKTLSHVRRIIKKSRSYASLEPTKHMAWIYLIEAENAAVLGKIREALNFFEQSIEAFKSVPSHLFHAIALVRAGRYCHSIGHTKAETIYMAEALKTLKMIGVTAIERILGKIWNKEHHADVLDDRMQKALQSPDETFDLAAIMKSAQALSSEIVLENLLKIIMEITLQSAGAQRGYLILVKDDKLHIEAEGCVDKPNVTTIRSMPVEKCGLLSTSIINYVARTQKEVVLADARSEGEFASDHYIRDNKIKSLLAAPLLSSGTLKGIIYLENNLATHAFSPDRLKILDILSTQAAISLENARLFENVKTAENKLREFNTELEKRVEERTSELKTAYDQIKIMALTDPLTGLSNRRAMVDKITHETIRFKRNRKPFALIIADIDHFKHINDQYGHDGGDYVLVALARIMGSFLREQDTVARWGGEEFLFLLPETEQNGAVTAMEKIRQAICEKPVTFNNLKIDVSMTFGVSIYDNRNSVDQCLKQADQALYDGKKSGRNRIVLSG